MEKFFDFVTLRPPDLITALTYVLMDNFCSCLIDNSAYQMSNELEDMKEESGFAPSAAYSEENDKEEGEANNSG